MTAELDGRISKIRSILKKYLIVIVFVAFFTILSLMSEHFFTVANMLNLARQISFNMIISVGMTFVIISGGIDLSVGSIVALTGVIVGSFVSTDYHPAPFIVAILMGLLTGISCGAVNGVLVTKGKAPPFIATMATTTIYAGLALVYCNGRNIINFVDGFDVFGGGYVGIIPIPVIVMIFILILGWLLLNNFSFGRHAKAVGGNELAAKAAGLNIDKIRIIIYMISGGMASISAILMISRLNAAQPLLGEGYETNAISAVVIGGTSLSGGIGTIWGTIIGAMLIGCITNGLDLLNVSSYYQDVVKGLIILTAVLLDQRGK